MLTGKDGCLSTLCHSFELACQQSVMTTYFDPGYLYYQERIVGLWHFLVILEIYSLSFHLATAQLLNLTVSGRNGSLITLCYRCDFACQ